jgi:hypothetical protein
VATDSPQEDIANGIRRRLPVLRDRARYFYDNRPAERGGNLMVQIETADLVQPDRMLVDAPSVAAENPRTEWRPHDASLGEAFTKDIMYLANSIVTVVRKVNLGNDKCHNPRASIKDIAALGEQMDLLETAYVLRSNDHLNRAIQLYMTGLQMYTQERRRRFATDFGGRDTYSNKERAEEIAIAMMRAEMVAGLPPGQELSDSQKAQIDYTVRFAAGYSQVVTGEYWQLLATQVNGEVLTGTDESGAQTRPMENPQSGVVSKLAEIVIGSEAETFGAPHMGIYGVPVDRYMGRGPQERIIKPEGLTKTDYERIAAIFRDASRVGDARAVRMRREFRTLRDILGKQVGDVLSMGKWRAPQISQAVERFTADASREGLTGMALRESVIENMRREWGARGVINYIDDNVDKILKEDPRYTRLFMRIKQVRTEEEVQANERSEMRRALSGARKLVSSARSGSGTANESVNEEIRMARDAMRAELYKKYVYDPLMRSNPTMALVLQDRFLTPPEAGRAMVRDELGKSLIAAMKVGGREVASADLHTSFRALESLSHFQDRTGRVPDARVVKTVLDAYGMATRDDDVETYMKRYKTFRKELQEYTDSRTGRGRALDLATQFAQDHALGLGSYNAQLTGFQVRYSEFVARNVNIGIIGGLEARTDLKTLHNELFATGGILSKTRITDAKSAEEAAGGIAEKIDAMTKKMTLNPLEQMRIRGELIVLIVSAVIDNGNGPTIYLERPPGSIPIVGLGNEQRRTQREYLAYHLLHKCGIPFSPVLYNTGSERTATMLSPVTGQDVFHALGLDFDSMRRWNAAGAAFEGLFGSKKS